MTGGDDSGRAPVEFSGRRLLLALAIAALCWWGGRFLPFPPGTEAGPACRLLFVTGLTIACWLLAAMPIAAASLLPLALLPLLSVQSTAELTRGYGNPILWLFAGGFVLALAVERAGLHRRLALGIVAALGAQPRRLVLAFLLAATCVSMWINNTAVALLLLPIGTALVQRVQALGELQPRAMANFGACIMCAIAFGASIGGIGSPIGTAPNLLFFANYQPLVSSGAPPVSFLQWFVAFAPLSLLLAVLASSVLVHVALPVPGRALAGGDAVLQEARALGRWRSPEKRAALLFAAAVLLWMTRGDLPLAGGDVLHGWAHWLLPDGTKNDYIADGTVAVLVAIVAFVLPDGAPGGRRLVDWQTARQMPIDLLLLLGGGMALADAFGPTGLSAAFGAQLQGVVGTMHPLAVITLLAGGTTVLSEIASNTALATLLLPIVREGAIAAKVDPLMLMLPAVIAASFSFALPIATPPNTIVFASRQITFGQMVRAGLCVDLLSLLLLVPALWWWVFPLLGAQVGAR